MTTQWTPTARRLEMAVCRSVLYAAARAAGVVTDFLPVPFYVK
jgi:hypothetical protein